MDSEVIEHKLELLRRCRQRMAAKCPVDAQTLATDPDLQDIVTLNLSRAVQVCVDIGAHLIAAMDVPAPASMAQTFDLLAQAGVLPVALARRLKEAVGFRNDAVLGYEAINWNIVHGMARRHPDDFAEFAKAVAAHEHLAES